MTKTALILSGGGARGAYQVGVLKALASAVPKGTMPFSVISGVSVGALAAVMLGSAPHDFREGVARLESVWRQLHSDDVFVTDNSLVRGRIFEWMRAALPGIGKATAPASLLDNSPLWDLVRRHADFDTINEIGAGEGGLDALAVTASSYRSGRAVTFFAGRPSYADWSRARRMGVRTRFGPEHVLASAALPLIFPSVAVGERYFGDGALRNSFPLSPAIRLGADRLVVIGARDKKTDAEEGAMTEPSVGYLAGQMLDILFNDNLEADVEIAERFNRSYRSLPAHRKAQSSIRPIDILPIDPSIDIRPIAGDFLHEMPGSARLMLRTIGGLKAPYILPSYLLFEPGYIQTLMDLGEADGYRALNKELLLGEVACPASQI
ncbi:Patatin [Parvularcula bermudensis HTCC2503]|uniref:Patatin n=1 Tax=Parvularcula bermudensis (strain ATCC BAA-594 / HTCC2503 / KCTC 12087) TaxID=314260 RepID=E0TD37_PARBH|nr:patatin-like phospholipase family protein [Parvularcula bermudensis]ADM08696.1 Patatin [Parvularcula bermudensis HTCC2503]